jgi:hypothetical protein
MTWANVGFLCLGILLGACGGVFSFALLLNSLSNYPQVNPGEDSMFDVVDFDATAERK